MNTIDHITDSKKKVHFNNLTALRFFAALSVLIYHFFGGKVLKGHYGVILFFVLSGFLITYLLLEEYEFKASISLRKFYVRRILRIWPLYYLAILISYFFIHSPFGEQMNDGNFFKALPYYLFFIPNAAFVIHLFIFPIAILWSIGAEEQFYVLWPLLIKFFRKRFLLIASSILCLFVAIPNILDFIEFHYPSRSNESMSFISHMMIYMSFNSMATGALLAYVAKYHPQYLRLLFHKVVQVSVYLILFTFWILHIRVRYAPDQFYATLFGIVIVNLAVNPQTILRLENRLLNYLGKISYGLYVYHICTYYLIIYVLSNFFPFIQVHSLVAFFIWIGFTIGIAALSFEFFEKPFLNWKEKAFSIVKSG